MAINLLTTSNTFGDWLITTNNLVAVANSLTDGGINTYITRSFGHANASFTFSNTVNVRTQSAYDLSNTTNTISYAIHNHVNAAFRTANSLSDYANTVNVQTQSAYDYANTVNIFAQNVLIHANAGFTQSNSTNTLIYQIQSNVATMNVTLQNVYDLSNTTNLHARSAYIHANASFAFSNTVNVKTQAAYDFANTVNVRTQAAYDFANTVNVRTQAAYDRANTDFTTSSVVAGTYGTGNLMPIINVEANGRISAITNTPYPVTIQITQDTTSVTDQYILFSDTVGSTSNLRYSSTSLSFKPSTNTLTVPNIAVTGAITENVYSFTGSVSATIDAKFGTVQVLTLAGSTTLTDAMQSGQYITLLVNDGTGYTITWPTIVWAYGIVPVLDTTKYTVIGLFKIGSSLYGIDMGTL